VSQALKYIYTNINIGDGNETIKFHGVEIDNSLTYEVHVLIDVIQRALLRWQL
jgi:hypothetical protein